MPQMSPNQPNRLVLTIILRVFISFVSLYNSMFRLHVTFYCTVLRSAKSHNYVTLKFLDQTAANPLLHFTWRWILESITASNYHRLTCTFWVNKWPYWPITPAYAAIVTETSHTAAINCSLECESNRKELFDEEKKAKRSLRWNF